MAGGGQCPAAGPNARLAEKRNGSAVYERGTYHRESFLIVIEWFILSSIID